MLASTTPALFNNDMDSKNPLNAQIRNHGLGSGRKTAPRMASLNSFKGASPADSAHAVPEPDWQATGIVDQMLAYRDWWNLPVRRPLHPNKSR
jgi:hypothetical protein